MASSTALSAARSRLAQQQLRTPIRSSITRTAAVSSRTFASTSLLRKDGDEPQGHLPGHPSSVFLTSLNDSFFDRVKPKTLSGNANAQGGIPTYRLMDGVGRLLPGVTDEMVNITQAEAVKMYRTMLLLPQIDVILYNAQRQGRISFMMTSYGEEGAVIGSAAGLALEDEVFAQYRESGVLLWRDFSIDHFMSQVFGAEDDLCGGRQMPIHFGSTQHHFHTISSPLATQIPQAAGAGYALKRTKGREGNVVICYFGEGAASEGDFHAGMNLASTTKSPVIFFVRNNGYAISTPASEQFRGDGIASRGPGYGMLTIRVDGNDALAVRSAVQSAKAKALSEQRPVLIEAMTYRVGHHSTSDDSSAYRSKQAVENWKQMDNPLHRMRNFLTDRGWWNDKLEEETKAQHRKTVIEAMGRAEKKKRPQLSSLFEGTYRGEMPGNLKEQRAELAELIEKYGALPAWSKELAKHANGGKDMEQYRAEKA